LIELQHVTKRYPDGTEAVKDLSFTAPTGQITALVGPSGCGKTTTLRMINRLIEPTEGTILLDGDDVTRQDKVALRRRIGYVIQSAGLMPHKRVLANITTVPRLMGVKKAECEARARELLDLVGLDQSFADRFPAQLSGGQSQRVGVARALAADPPFMLMDEPFSAVDPIVRQQLQQEFLALQKRVAKTIVLVTHDIAEALLLGDQIVVLGQAAAIEQQGTPYELLSNPANEFVSDFLGRSRGYQALGFEQAGDLPLQPGPVVRASDLGRADPRRWTLILDDGGRPAGWQRGTEHRAAIAAIRFPAESLRVCLDSALAGPSGLGVAVDADGVFRGTFRLGDVLAQAAFDSQPWEGPQ
jgi:osmoprotectant transport system ATP-binding protein